MKAIFGLQWQRLRRQPLMILAMISMTILFIFFIGGSGDQSMIAVPTSFSESMHQDDREKWLTDLNSLEGFEFIETDQTKAKEQIALGSGNFGIHITPESYTFLVGTEGHNRAIVDQHIGAILYKHKRIDQVINQTGNEELRESIETSLERPPIEVQSSIGNSKKDVFIYDNQLQALFGMTLFFAIYTIVFTLSEVAEEKQRGSWDRLILSPIRKWQIYLGYLSYSFIIGILQIIIIFIMFHYLFDFQIGDHWLKILFIIITYTFAIVSLGMLLIGLVRKSSQLNAVVPIVAVSMSMLGGAYWPIEIVDNQVVLAISKVLPVTYAMNALKGVAIYQQTISDIAQPLSILCLMGVICMGIGINLMERR